MSQVIAVVMITSDLFGSQIIYHKVACNKNTRKNNAHRLLLDNASMKLLGQRN